ncbi:MAG: PqqD family protein, partial [Terriglobales bacterium]
LMRRIRRYDFSPSITKHDWRQPFSWCAHHWLCLSPHVIYWFPEAERSVVVRGVERFSFEGVGTTFFRGLCAGKNRETIVDEVCLSYHRDENEVSKDLDDFVVDLISQKIIDSVDVRHSRAVSSSAKGDATIARQPELSRHGGTYVRGEQ